MKNSPPIGRMLLIVSAKVGCAVATVVFIFSFIAAAVQVGMFVDGNKAVVPFFALSAGLSTGSGFVALILSRVANKWEKPFVVSATPDPGEPNTVGGSAVRRGMRDVLIAVGAVFCILVAVAALLFTAVCIRECIPHDAGDDRPTGMALLGAGMGIAIFVVAFFGAFKLGRVKGPA